MADKTHGRFTLHDDRTITGPKDYMEQRFESAMDEMAAGRNISLKCVAIANPELPSDAKILAALQLDYADWAGIKGIIDSLK